jgi:hypothetical protein
MDDREARKRTEMHAALAMAGGAYDWKNQPIGETPQARATDPSRLSRSNWWIEAEPAQLDVFRQTGPTWLDNLKKFASRGRDDKAAEQQSIHPKDSAKDRGAKGKGKRRAGRDQGGETSFKEYLPKPGDNIHTWLSDLATKLDMNLPGRVNWYGALRNYVAKYKPETKARELDQDTLASLIRMICEEEEAA